MVKGSKEKLLEYIYTCKPKKECKSQKCGMWPWKVPKWPWFLAKVAVKPFRDLSTLVHLDKVRANTVGPYTDHLFSH
jgi:hypothetical protein